MDLAGFLLWSREIRWDPRTGFGKLMSAVGLAGWKMKVQGESSAPKGGCCRESLGILPLPGCLGLEFSQEKLFWVFFLFFFPI